MIRVKLECDADNRTFTLVDRECGSILQDGAVYELNLPSMLEDPDGEVSLISSELGTLAAMREQLMNSFRKKASCDWPKFLWIFSQGL